MRTTLVSGPRIGDLITENMGTYRVLQALGGTRFAVVSAVGHRLEIDFANSDNSDSRNTWRIPAGTLQGRCQVSTKVTAETLTETCPTCGAAAGTRCWFDAFERLDGHGTLRERDGINDIHSLRSAAINARKAEG